MEKDYQELLTAISCMLDEKLEEKLEQKLEQKLEEKLDRKFDERLSPITADLTILKEQVVALNEKMDVMQLDISDLRKGQEHNARIIENQIIPDIRLLAENYVPAAKSYQEAKVKRNAMETDIKLLKIVVADHSTKLCESVK